MSDAVAESEELRTVREAFTRFMEAFNAGAFEEAWQVVVREVREVGPHRYLEGARARRLREFADRDEALAAAGLEGERN